MWLCCNHVAHVLQLNFRFLWKTLLRWLCTRNRKLWQRPPPNGESNQPGQLLRLWSCVLGGGAAPPLLIPSSPSCDDALFSLSGSSLYLGLLSVLLFCVHDVSLMWWFFAFGGFVSALFQHWRILAIVCVFQFTWIILGNLPFQSG